MHGRLATVTDRRQALRLRRLAFSLLMGGAAHTLVCWLILQWGFFRGGATVFYALFGTIWAGHLGLLLFARTGLNRRLNNPAMTEPVMIWCILTLLASALYLDQGRLAVMAFFFAILHQGVFRVRRRQVARAAALAVAGYALVLLYLNARGDLAQPLLEAGQWLLFSLVTLAMVLLASEITTIRLRLRERNGQLAELLEYLLRVQLPFRFDRQALPGVFVNDRQQPEGSALVGTVIQEVVDPNMILALGPQSDARAVVEPQARPFGLFLRHFQPLLPPDPLHSFRVH